MPMPNEEDIAETTEIERIVKEAAEKIGEHTDSCIILVTKRMESGSKRTWAYSKLTGCYYACYGHIREWVVQEEGMQARRYSPPDDDSDEESP